LNKEKRPTEEDVKKEEERRRTGKEKVKKIRRKIGSLGNHRKKRK
jgi:hypothetical protein